MSRKAAIIIAAAAALAVSNSPVAAQVPEVPTDMRAKTLPRQNLNGPRFGFTTFTGDIAKARQSVDLQPIMTQFGWQFETQIVSLTGGNQALMEWVVLVGGVEEDNPSLSLAWLAGYRLESGLEFGVGPNISIAKGQSDPTTSMVVAAGATMPFGDLYVPLNVAVAMAEGGPRITTLIGWIVG
jgi:hypothetical protein